MRVQNWLVTSVVSLGGNLFGQVPLALGLEALYGRALWCVTTVSPYLVYLALPSTSSGELDG